MNIICASIQPQQQQYTFGDSQTERLRAPDNSDCMRATLTSRLSHEHIIRSLNFSSAFFSFLDECRARNGKEWKHAALPDGHLAKIAGAGTN